MNTETTQSTALEIMVDYLKERMSPRIFPLEGSRLIRDTILLLSKGEAVSPKEIALASCLSIEQTQEILSTLKGYGMAAFDDEGKVVGMIISVVPARHKFQVEGKDLYAWCAATPSSRRIF